MPLVDYLSDQSLAEAGTNREELSAIQVDFEQKAASYEQAAQAITSILLKTPGVHSVRYRIKDSAHLLEKVVRKRLENKDRVITVENYEEELTDLAGVRILHLFKGDWQRIHEFIISTWAQHEDPTAYYREGDSAEVLSMFTNQQCQVKQHPAGYRSVHYIAETSPTRAKRYVEIQVRTIFEEGWSEVDHKIRYPNFSDNPLTNNLLLMLNRLAGNADEMSSFVQDLNNHFSVSRQDFERLEREKDEQIKKLEDIIKNSKMPSKDKDVLESVAKSLTEAQRIPANFERWFTPNAAILAAIEKTNTLSDLLGNKNFDLLGNKVLSDFALPGTAVLTQLDKIASTAAQVDKLNQATANLDKLAQASKNLNNLAESSKKLSPVSQPKKLLTPLSKKSEDSKE